ncbi:hypothetical protein CXP47_20330 [Pseudomonas chlororaphis]|nr:hypothetical protein CXP47_20330 [Pseudomonas chlororaphis]POA64328.1 hypothetical protein C1888_27025 [Pseudomonas sp. GW531-T4]PWY51158.1 hypothetical protein DK261_03870 [Pseudomonas sp. RW409]
MGLRLMENARSLRRGFCRVNRRQRPGRGNRKVLQRRFRKGRQRRLDAGIFGDIERVGMGDGCAAHRGQASLLQVDVDLRL